MEPTSALLCTDDGVNETEGIKKSNTLLLIENVMDLERYNTLRKLTRVTAYVRVFKTVNPQMIRDQLMNYHHRIYNMCITYGFIVVISKRMKLKLKL